VITSLRSAAIRRAGAEFLYVTAGVPLGLAWLIVLLTALAVGIATAVVIVGLPLLAATLVLVQWGANTERERAALVLGAPIPRPPAPPRAARWLGRWRGRLRNRANWKELGYMLLLGPVGVLTGAIVLCLWSAALAALAAPLVSGAASSGSWLGVQEGDGRAARLGARHPSLGAHRPRPRRGRVRAGRPLPRHRTVCALGHAFHDGP
jgi:hypothetical protein